MPVDNNEHQMIDDVSRSTDRISYDIRSVEAMPMGFAL